MFSVGIPYCQEVYTFYANIKDFLSPSLEYMPIKKVVVTPEYFSKLFFVEFFKLLHRNILFKVKRIGAVVTEY